MSQTETGKAVAADERTEAARSFVRTVKAATRRKYTPEEKIRIVLEGFRREVTEPVSEVGTGNGTGWCTFEATSWREIEMPLRDMDGSKCGTLNCCRWTIRPDSWPSLWMLG